MKQTNHSAQDFQIGDVVGWMAPGSGKDGVEATVRDIRDECLRIDLTDPSGMAASYCKTRFVAANRCYPKRKARTNQEAKEAVRQAMNG